MSVALWLALVVGAGPSVRVEACPDGWLDVRQVRAQLSIAHVVWSDDVVVRCEGATVSLTHRTETRSLTLTGTTAEQRQRTLALFLSSWLMPPKPVQPRVELQRTTGARGDAGQVSPTLPERSLRVPDAGDVKPRQTVDDAGTSKRDARAELDRGEAVGSSIGFDAGALNASRREGDAGAQLATTALLPVDAGALNASSREVDAGAQLATTVALQPVDAGALNAPSREVDAGAQVATTLASLPVDAGLTAEENTVPIELGFVPGVGLNRLFPEPTVNHFALGLIGVSSTRVDGASLGLISLSRGRLRGFQLGGVVVAGDVRGAQFGVVAVSDDFQGLQLAPVVLASELHGVQLAGLLANSSHDVVGFQGSAFNRAGHSLFGVQLGGLNVAGDVVGAQLGIINIADDVTGLQVGFLNVARKMVGTQVGIINISRDGPAPIGPFNVTEDAPMRLALTLGDTHLLNVALKSGGTRLYGLLSLGWVPRTAVRAGGGLGLHLGSLSELGWFGEVELVSHAVLNLDSVSLGAVPTLSLGLNAGYRIAPRLALIAGLQASVFFGTPAFPGNTVSLFGIPLGTGGVAFGPGAQFGIEL